MINNIVCECTHTQGFLDSKFVFDIWLHVVPHWCQWNLRHQIALTSLQLLPYINISDIDLWSILIATTSNVNGCIYFHGVSVNPTASTGSDFVTVIPLLNCSTYLNIYCFWYDERTFGEGKIWKGDRVDLSETPGHIQVDACQMLGVTAVWSC